MNRRDFFLRAASLLPLPAFVRAASLWLPPERPFVVPEPEWKTFNGLWNIPGHEPAFPWDFIFADEVDDTAQIHTVVQDVLRRFYVDAEKRRLGYEVEVDQCRP